MSVLCQKTAYTQNIMTYLRQLQPITQIVLGEDDHLRTGSPCSNGLLSKSSNAQYLARERELTSHRYTIPDLSVESQGQEAGSHGNACTGAVFWDCALGAVQMYPCMFEESVFWEIASKNRLGV